MACDARRDALADPSGEAQQCGTLCPKERSQLRVPHFTLCCQQDVLELGPEPVRGEPEVASDRYRDSLSVRGGFARERFEHRQTLFRAALPVQCFTQRQRRPKAAAFGHGAAPRQSFGQLVVVDGVGDLGGLGEQPLRRGGRALQSPSRDTQPLRGEVFALSAIASARRTMMRRRSTVPIAARSASP